MKKKRIVVVLSGFVFLAVVLVGYLVRLQVFKREFYQALARGGQESVNMIKQDRGEVFFRDGTPMVINKEDYYLFISPREIGDEEGVRSLLVDELGFSKDVINEKIEQPNYFEIVKESLSSEERKIVSSSDVRGVYIDKKKERYYPQGEITAHITGFVGEDDQGYYGLEGFYDQHLGGEERIVKRKKGPFGFLDILPSERTRIETTIDPSLQLAAYNLLKDNSDDLEFRSGQVLVMNPQDGEVLALAQYPSYDPNNYSEVEDAELFKNYLVNSVYEPGSVFKAITMASAINEHRVTPQTTYIDKGTIEVSGEILHNYDDRVWGEQDMTSVLEHSINTGAVFAGSQLGHSLFLEYLDNFGFLKKTGIGLQGEVFSKNKEVQKSYDVNFATATFGQGISVTPVQLAQGFSALVNEGMMVPPHLVEEKEGKRIISEESSQDITNMLVSVVENGFAKQAQLEGHYVGGKTGTAQIPWPYLGINRSGYSEETIQTFIGFFPAYDPQYLVLVKLDAPKTKTAGYSSVPLFQRLGELVVNIKSVAPTKE